MAINPSAEPAGHRADGIRGLGHMDRGLREDSERIFDSRRVRLHGAISKSSDNLHPLRAWIILGIVSPTGVAAFAAVTAIATKGH